MQAHEETLREQYANLLAIFQTNFPHIEPPEPRWWLLWMQKYDFGDIRTAIERLGKHGLKAHFTQESTGKALITLMRDAAMRQAITGAVKTGGRSSKTPPRSVARTCGTLHWSDTACGMTGAHR